MPVSLEMPVDLASAEAFMAESGKGKVPASTQVRTESFSYPGWERYTVQRPE